MNTSEELLLAFYMGNRLTLYAHGIQEPPLGENQALLALFRVAAGESIRRNPADAATELHFSRELAERIVDGLMDAPALADTGR
jgi:hypothetical protein